MEYSACWILFFNYCCDKHKSAVATGLAEQPVLWRIESGAGEESLIWQKGGKGREGKGLLSLSPDTSRVAMEGVRPRALSGEPGGPVLT